MRLCASIQLSSADNYGARRRYPIESVPLWGSVAYFDELRYLLDLDGERFQMGGGYWTKFDVKLVESTAEIPHGIRYSLTLHDQSGRRLLGFDNAHGLKRSRRGANRRVVWDHHHDKDRVTTYDFTSAAKLLEDFWLQVNKVLSDT